MRVNFYDTPQRKRQLINDSRSRGETIIHDDFINSRGQITDGRSGKLTSEILPDPPDRVIKSLDELNLLLFKKEIVYIELLDLLTIQALKDMNSRWSRFRAMFTP